MTTPFRHLTWNIDDDGEGRHILEAMASWREADAAVRDGVEAELQQVLGWARRAFGDAQGPLDEGHAWDLDLQRHREADGWHTVTLTLAAAPRFHEAFLERFGDPLQDDDAA